MELTKLDDSVKTRISTETVLGPFVREGYSVRWIEWDSAFRDTDLQIGDLVVGLNGEAYTDVADGNRSGSAVGMYGEEYFWEKAGGKEGDKVTLQIVRNGVEKTIEGELRAHRFYYNEAGKQSLAPGGPELRINDGFSGAWSYWYETIIKSWGNILNDGWNRNNLNNRKVLADQLEHKARINFLQENHPGPFADTMAKDYDRVLEYLRGKKYELSEDDLAYRELGEKRAQMAAESAQVEWDKIIEDLQENTRETFPAPEMDKRDEEIGKVVVLPWITLRQIVNDLGKSYAVFGSRYDGYYFIDLSNEKAQRFFDTYYRFRALVNPNTRDRYRFIGRILDDPRMITYRDDTVTGLMLEIVAVRAGDGEGEMFTHLSDSPPDTFAGEDTLRSLVEIGDLPDDLKPEEVIETMIRAVQQGSLETWKQTFADWRAWARKKGEAYLNMSYHLPDHVFSRPWENSRRSTMDKVFDSRISKVGPVITLAEANSELHTPRIQEVVVFVDHIGLFEGEYRPFNNSSVTRPWKLQRLGEGPWRITDVQHL